MKVGDLVKIIDVEPDDHRKMGAVLRHDVYSSSPYGKESIIEVAWSSSSIGWILESRLEVISESR